MTKLHEVEEISSALEDVASTIVEFKAASKDAQAKFAAAIGSQTSEATKKAEEAVARVQQLGADLVDMEQRIAAKVSAEGQVKANESLGRMFVNSQAYKAVAPKEGDPVSQAFRVHVEMNTLSGQAGSPPENVDTLVEKTRQAGIIPGAFRQLKIADYISFIPVTSNAYEFVREKTFTNNAAETAEGASKPQSVLEFETKTVNIRTIPHFIKATTQILSDAPSLRSYIDTRLSYGVNLRLDYQLLRGDGTGQNISGMTDSGNFTAYTPVTGDTALDSINRAANTIRAADYNPDGIVLNPATWGVLERLKDTTGVYLIGNPQGMIQPMLWGLPVLTSNNMEAAKFLMADFAMSYSHLGRQATVVEIGFDGNDFTKNLVTIRAERRSALAIYKTTAILHGALTA